ncbi:peptidase family C78-domain-containing protein [Mycena maculata]|uniref:Peptidase family C78-domain-containing protein n=1 Tax=Mycena maculata TaxID=230809 RepID=A0AAD7NE49_9AGAR|nr:peptidase family C78-domain-containing protein [Mycena maculata]
MSYTISGGRINDTTSVQCQICSANLDRLSVPQRNLHYDKHFGDEPKPDPKAAHPQPKSHSFPASSSKKPSQSASDSPSRAGFSFKDWGGSIKFKGVWNDKEKDKFWYPAQSANPPPNFTPGLILLLKKHLSKSHSAGNTRRAVLCYDRAVLVNRELWDAGWGCGYRNFMMACTSLMDQQIQPLYFPLLDHPMPPSVRNLQHWIEDAWEAGFDPEGARQLKNLVGSKKWIGTTDLQVAFTSRGIPSKLVDFDLKANARGSEILTNWVVEYFSHPHGSVDSDKAVKDQRPKTINEVLLGASAVTSTPRMPLILQHAGHSRTIVGYEVSKKGFVNLLEFDPSKIPKKRLHQAGLDTFSSMPPRQDIPRTNAVASTSSGKRPATPQSINPTPLKRSRVDNQGRRPDDDDDDEVQIIHDSRDENLPGRGKITSSVTSPARDKKKGKEKPEDTMSTSDVLNFFRLDPKKLEKNKAYQVLYFPMTGPLSDLEIRLARGMPLVGEKIS